MAGSFIEYYLNEKRRNPEKNPFKGAWYYAEKFRDDPDVYITFTDISKVGINPQSDFNTPIGIYCYPLREFWEFYMKDVTGDDMYNKILGDYAPFAGGSDYINFLRLTDKKNFIDDMYTDYGSNDFDRDTEILKKRYKDQVEKELKEQEAVSTSWNRFVEIAIIGAIEKNPVMCMWNITRKISSALDSNKRRASVKWNSILRKDLGYAGFADKSGRGYIHTSERMQAVFLTTRAFELITREENKVKKLDENMRNALEAVNRNVDNINNLSEEMQIKLLKYNGQAEFLTSDRSYFQAIKNPSERVQKEAVRVDPEFIRFIDDPSDRVQYNALSTAKNKFDMVKFDNIFTIIKNNVKAKNLSEDIRKYLVSVDPRLLEDIPDPSDDIIKKALEKDPIGVISYIEKPENWMYKTAFDTAVENSMEYMFLGDLNNALIRDKDFKGEDLTEETLKYFIEKSPWESVKALQELLDTDMLVHAVDYVDKKKLVEFTMEIVDRYVNPLTDNAEINWDRLPEKLQMKLVKKNPDTYSELVDPTDKVEKLYKDLSGSDEE